MDAGGVEQDLGPRAAIGGPGRAWAWAAPAQSAPANSAAQRFMG